MKAAHRTKVGGKFTLDFKRKLAEVMAGTASENVFQYVVVALACDNAWLVHATPKAQVREGRMVTPTQGHTGFPDLVLVRGDRVIFAELKSRTGTSKPMQLVWGDRLAALGGPATHVVWRPKDWPEIKTVLSLTPVRNVCHDAGHDDRDENRADD